MPNAALQDAIEAHPSNLPVQPTPLIGREKEVAAVCAMLRRPEVRLVNMLGPGGAGKTRLAVQVATEALGDFPDGVFFVNLAPIHDSDLALLTIGQTLGLRESGEQPPLEMLKEYLSDKRMLLALDNFEQILAAAPLVSQLLMSAPQLKALVTSRIVLRLSTEHEYPVPPLSVPDVERSSNPEDLLRYEAVRLFVARARTVRPDFKLSPSNAQAVAGICRRLDGLPLAIELAAARIKILSPQALLARLENRLRLLTAGPQDKAARHQTLRNTLDWSYDLLDPEEQRLFRWLGVFSGGCTIEAIEAVCSAEDNLKIDILDGLASLVDNSLVYQREEVEGEPRFWMLETIQEYARERLEASGDAEALRHRHANFFLELAKEAEPHLTGSGQKVWLARLAEEYDNVRAVLEWALRQGPEEVNIALQLSGAIWRFWHVHGYWSEGRRWLEAAVATDGSVQTSSPSLMAARAKVFSGAGALARSQNDYASARLFHEQSLALRRRLQDKPGIATSLNNLGNVALGQGDYATAYKFHEESLALRRELGDKWAIANSLNNLGNVVIGQGDYATARLLYEESLALSRELGNKQNIADALNNLGRVAFYQGDYTTACSLQAESLAFERELGNKQGIAISLYNLADVALHQDDDEQARLLCIQGMKLNRELGDKMGIAECLEGLATVAGKSRCPDKAAHLWGASEALREEIGSPLQLVERSRYDRWVAMARSQLDEASWQAAWAEGRAMPLEQAIALALEPVSPAPAPAPAPPQTYGLTKREVQVLCLLATGMTYAQIAEKLVIALRTVETHLTSVYGKLGVSSRSEAMLFALEHKLCR